MQYILHPPVAGECQWWRIFDRYTAAPNGPFAFEVARFWDRLPGAEEAALRETERLNSDQIAPDDGWVVRCPQDGHTFWQVVNATQRTVAVISQNLPDAGRVAQIICDNRNGVNRGMLEELEQWAKQTAGL